MGGLELYEVKKFLQRELSTDLNQAKKVLNIMFDEIDHSLFKEEAIDFYIEVFKDLLGKYFHSYKNTQERQKYKEIIKLLETKIKEINNDEKLCIQMTKG